MELDLECLKDENIELREYIIGLEEENEKLKHSLSKIGSPLTKEESKLLGEIHKCKIELKKENLRKTGYNSHNKYSYFELGDFLPCLERILDKHGLGSYCYFENFKGYLIIFDVDSGVFHSWDTPCKIPHVKENGFDVGVHMKAEQAVQTYARRTLYLQAFDIVEPNVIENDGNKNEKQYTQIPEDIDDTTKHILAQIKKDFGNKVEFNKTTISNKLQSMKKSKKIDEETYSKCITVVEKME